MIELRPLPGFSITTKESISNFIAGYPGAVEDLGPSSDPALHVYGIRIGDTDSKPCMFIQGGIHGQHEWTSCYWVRRFASYLVDPANSPQPDAFYFLRDRLSFYIIPCLNVWGYENGPNVPYSKDEPQTRNNANGVDLNRNFDFRWDEAPDSNKGQEPFDQPESKIVRGLVTTLKPVAFLDWHTWGNEQLQAKFGSRVIGAAWHDVLERRVTDRFRRVTGEPWDVSSRGHGRPIAADWASTQTSRMNYPTLAWTPEISYMYPVETQMSLGLTANLAFALKIADWVRTRRQEW